MVLPTRSSRLEILQQRATSGFIKYELIASVELWGFPVGATTRFFVMRQVGLSAKLIF
jgi:hypothetical protein